MKKNIYLLAAAALAIGLSSCKSENGASSLSYSIPTYNLITSTSSPDKVELAGTAYRYNFNMSNNTVQMTGEVTVGENNKFTLTTESLPYKSNYYRTEFGTYEVIKIGGEFAGSTTSGDKVRDLDCELTTLIYIPPVVTGLPTVSHPNQYTIMQYNLGADRRVRTFWPDVTFRGTTTSHYQDRDGLQASAENKEILYRVIMDLKNNKATVILYNAKFSNVEQEPVKSNIVLKDLTLKFSAFGYEITGTNVIPECYEGGKGTPNSNYKFDNFTLTSSGDLVDSQIDFSVAGMYSANFTGSYALRVGKTPEL